MGSGLAAGSRQNMGFTESWQDRIIGMGRGDRRAERLLIPGLVLCVSCVFFLLTSLRLVPPRNTGAVRLWVGAERWDITSLYLYMEARFDFGPFYFHIFLARVLRH